MIRTIALLGLIVAGEANADDAPPQAGAAMVEWVLSNCASGEIPVLTIQVASLIVAGSTPEQMAPWREKIRQGVSTHYPDKAAACADLLSFFRSVDQ